MLFLLQLDRLKSAELSFPALDTIVGWKARISSCRELSLEILFDYNSATLSEKGREQLRPVGDALANPDLKGKQYIIEGHTDVVGGDQFNIDLSRRRAAAVKEFLLSQGLPAYSLKIEGKGKQNLADKDDPTSEVNRRVRIVMLNN